MKHLFLPGLAPPKIAIRQGRYELYEAHVNSHGELSALIFVRDNRKTDNSTDRLAGLGSMEKMLQLLLLLGLPGFLCVS